MTFEQDPFTKLAQAITNLQASSSQNAQQQLPEASISAVSIKLPEFWPEDPEIWFIRVEAQLRSRAVTHDQTKFDYVVAALNNVTAAEVKSVLVNPPAEDKYKAIKQALKSAFGKTQAEKDAELLNISGLGDRKPSALLRKLESLNNNAETLRQAFFVAQLPSQVRSILALEDFADIHDLAKAADRIVEAQNISQPANLAAASVRQQPRFQYRNAPPRQKLTKENFICNYHQRFGPDARNCRPGCLFSKLIASNSAGNSLHQENAKAGRQ